MKLISSDKSEQGISDKANDFIIELNDKLIFSSENKYNLKFIINCISILYLMYGRILYIKPLKGCSNSEFDCLNYLQLIKDSIKNCLNSIVYFIFALFLMQLKICFSYILIILIIIYIRLIIRDHGENFINNRKLNLFALFS